MHVHAALVQLLFFVLFSYFSLVFPMREAQVRLINNKACLPHPRLLWIRVTTTPMTSGGGAGYVQYPLVQP